MPEPIEVNGTNWQSNVMDSDLPVMVDFWAEWCGPCKMIAPAVHDLALEYEGKLNVAKLDVDKRAGDRGAVRYPQHPGADFLQERPASGPGGGRAAQAGPEAEDRRGAGELSARYAGVDGARWLLRTSNPLCLVTSGVGGFDSLALPPKAAR